jgi:hypothetical protein
MIPRHVQIAVVLLLAGIFAGGFYALRLQRRAQQAAQQAEAHPVAPSVSGPLQKVHLWIAYDDDGVFRPAQAKVELPQEPSGRATGILRALIGEYLKQPSPHPLPLGSDVRTVYLVNGLAVVDLTPAFADGHRSGALLEEFTVTSMIATLSANMPEIKQVKFLVDGKERETLAGHADLLSVYDVKTVDQFVQGLQ